MVWKGPVSGSYDPPQGLSTQPTDRQPTGAILRGIGTEKALTAEPILRRVAALEPSKPLGPPPASGRPIQAVTGEYRCSH